MIYLFDIFIASFLDDFEDITSLAGLIDSPVYGVRKSCSDVPLESLKCQAGYLLQVLYRAVCKVLRLHL